MADYLLFAIAMLLGQFSPGPDFLLVAKNALNHGRRAALFSVLGIALGLLVHTSLALAGLAVLFESSQTAGRVLRLLGSMYLIYLALRLLSAPRRPAEANGKTAATSPPLPDHAAFVQGLLTNLLNPKVVIFISAMLAQFLDAGSSGTERAIYAAIIVIQGALCWALFAHLLQTRRIRREFLRRERAINLGFAALLAIIAATGLLSLVRPA